MKKLHKIFSHSFPHRIWRIVPAYGCPELAFEERDEDTTQIRLHRYRSGGELQTVQVPEMPWWSTLVSSHPGVFLVSSYGADGNAARQTLAAYDHDQGTRLWEREGVQLLEEGADRILITQDDSACWIDISSGDIMPADLINRNENENKEAVFPFRYTEDSEYFLTVNQFLARKGFLPMRHVIDYLELEENLLIAGYTRKESELNCELYVFDLQGNLLLEKRIGENLPGISDNTFFIYGGNLIFVTSRNDFFEYTLV